MQIYIVSFGLKKKHLEDHIVRVNTSKRQVIDDTGAGTGEIVNIEGEADEAQVEWRSPKNIA